MRYTEEYKALQQQLHAAGGYGTSGHKHAERITDFAKKLGTRSVMDYGAGQQTLAKAMPFAITNYDPFIEGLDNEPAPHDLVVCSDVLEHIEIDCLDNVLSHLESLTIKMLFVDIACRPAKKVLADGRNAHLIQQRPMWWAKKLDELFNVQSFQEYDGGMVALCTKRPE